MLTSSFIAISILDIGLGQNFYFNPTEILTVTNLKPNYNPIGFNGIYVASIQKYMENTHALTGRKVN